MFIKEELQLRGISINKCAIETGIPYGALHPIVNGKVDLHNCNYSTLKKLADYLSCSIDDFFIDITEFDVFWEDEKTASVLIEGSRVTINRYTTHPVKQIFASDYMTKMELGRILESRCWDRHRENIERYLFKLGVTSYNPYAICRKTHGVMVQDKTWFLFPDETLTWEDVRCS